jgi:hypothetical protein
VVASDRPDAIDAGDAPVAVDRDEALLVLRKSRHAGTG